MSVDLGGGKSKLTLANGANTGTVSNVDTLIGGTGTDTITLLTAMSNGSVSLGSRRDTLTLANAANSVTIANVETILGGTGSDTITLGAAVSNASIDLGTGTDTLTSATSPTPPTRRQRDDADRQWRQQQHHAGPPR